MAVRCVIQDGLVGGDECASACSCGGGNNPIGGIPVEVAGKACAFDRDVRCERR